MIASPPYLHRHEGPVFVCGNAACLHDDLERARKCFPNAAVIAVNGASREVLANLLFSVHADHFVARGFDWIRHQRRLFGEGFTVHGAKFQPGMPWINHWWTFDHSGGGSAWGARKIAKWIGFSPVILCGCPLLPGPYAGHRPGGIMHSADVTEAYAREIEADKGWHEGCYSMSGRTKEILGPPPS